MPAFLRYIWVSCQTIIRNYLKSAKRYFQSMQNIWFETFFCEGVNEPEFILEKIVPWVLGLKVEALSRPSLNLWFSGNILYTLQN